MVQRSLAIALLLVAGCSSDANQANPSTGPDEGTEIAQARASDAATSAAKAALEQEPKIVEVMFDPQLAVPWTIGVVDDGTRRTGYAEYVCQVLLDHDAVDFATTVRIVDRAKVIDNGGDFRAASLGHVDCNTFRDLGT